MNKAIAVIVILVIIVLGLYLLLTKPISEDVLPPAAPTETIVGEGPSSVTVVEVKRDNTITYIDSGYQPKVLRVKAGTIVTFQNGHTIGMWTASAFHPTHRNYPTTGGCLGSTFDACRAVPPGEAWDFVFNIPGTWTYHNHLKASDTGTIVVE